MFALQNTIAPNVPTREKDVLGLKKALQRQGYYDTPDYGLTPYPDRPLFDGIKNYQSDRGLKIDGIVRPGGETYQTLEMDEHTPYVEPRTLEKRYDDPPVIWRTREKRDTDPTPHFKKKPMFPSNEYEQGIKDWYWRLKDKEPKPAFPAVENDWRYSPSFNEDGSLIGEATKLPFKDRDMDEVLPPRRPGFFREAPLDFNAKPFFDDISGIVGNGFENDPEDVIRIENALKFIGLGTPKTLDEQTGILDRETTAIIKKLQGQLGLKTDGIIRPGGETAHGLQAVSNIMSLTSASDRFTNNPSTKGLQKIGTDPTQAIAFLKGIVQGVKSESTTADKINAFAPLASIALGAVPGPAGAVASQLLGGVQAFFNVKDALDSDGDILEKVNQILPAMVSGAQSLKGLADTAGSMASGMLTDLKGRQDADAQSLAQTGRVERSEHRSVFSDVGHFALEEKGETDTPPVPEQKPAFDATGRMIRSKEDIPPVPERKPLDSPNRPSILKGVNNKDVIQAITDEEDTLSYLYKDTAGKVTVGTGIMLPNAEEATKLSFTVPNGKGGRREATSEEIKSAFDKVEAVPGNNIKAESFQPGKGKMAKGFKLDDLKLSEEENAKIVDERVREAANSLRRKFPDFDSYSPNRQKALLDMEYNLGPAGFSKENWPNLFRAVEQRDWSRAARESHRKEEYHTGMEGRNRRIKKKFLDDLSLF